MLAFDVRLSDLGMNFGGFSSVDAVFKSFYRDAAKLIVEGIREILGTSDAWHLTEEYAKRKMRGDYGELYMVPGKDADQPLIRGGGIYTSIAAIPIGDEIRVGILPRGAGGRFISYRDFEDTDALNLESAGGQLAKYAQIWEERAHFIEKGVERAMPKVEALLQERTLELELQMTAGL